jgi:environmental stress-induced protein Ves
MGLIIIPGSQQVTSSWSGGTTTQLFIYPENASYPDRNFLFRISTATIEADESVFTKLPGISRKIMILKGTLKLEHTGKYTKILHPFDSDSFEGDWETKGYGKVTDFNLMMTGKLGGTVYVKFLKKDETIQFQSISGKEFTGLYVLKGKLHIVSAGIDNIAHRGDFVMYLPSENLKHIAVIALEPSEIAIAGITIPDFR